MQTRTLSTLVAVFSTDAEARSAAEDLKANGFASSDIFITAGNTTSTNETAARDYRQHEGGIKGWFHSLFGEDQDETNAAANRYESAVSTGNVLLSVETNEQNMDTAAEVLNRHSPVDVHRDNSADDTVSERTGSAATAGYTAAQTASTRDYNAGAQNTSQEAIPVVKEELRVGKRAILRGGVRVYSRVVEQPVEETIGLREERVRVDRTPVNREVTDADLRAGKENVIEMKEYAEEPVVSKTARVVEEVRVHKESTERNETVRDTVRNTEVRVENLGDDAAASGKGYASSSGSDDYTSDFRRDFQQRYGSSGEAYDTYAPAYQYGYTSASDSRYRGRNFDDVEQDLRNDYQQRYPNSTWERMKDSIRYGWNRVTGRS